MKKITKIESITIILTIKKKKKKKKIEPKYILINLKIYKDLKTSFTRYVPKISIKMLNLHYHELMGKIEECEGKNI